MFGFILIQSSSFFNTVVFLVIEKITFKFPYQGAHYTAYHIFEYMD